MEKYSRVPSVAGTIGYVKFSPLSEGDISDTSVLTIISDKEIDGSTKQPYIGGMYDLKMGAQFKYKCKTCGYKISDCIGHHGEIEVPVPLPDPMHREKLQKMFRMICGTCNKLIFDVDIKLRYPKYYDIPYDNERYTNVIDYLYSKKYSQMKTSKKLFCDHCENVKDQVSNMTNSFTLPNVQVNNPIPAYGENKFHPYLNRLKYSEDGYPKTSDDIVYTDEIYERVYKLPVSELEKLGLTEEHHPKNMIRKRIIVPGTVERIINNYGAKGEADNNITSAIVGVYRIARELEDVGPINKIKDDKKLAKIEQLLMKYYAYLGYTIGTPKYGKELDFNDGLYGKFKGKDGFIFGRMLGKVLDKMSRYVIFCYPHMDSDHVLIPRELASGLTVRETVTRYNIAKLSTYVKNGSSYPGVTRIIIHSGERYINDGKRTLEVGHIVERHLLNGDPITMHRSPTMGPSSLSSMIVQVWDGEEDIKCVGISETACAWFNADFDGDQMNQKAENDEAARFEQSFITGVGNYFTDNSNSTPYLGLIQDGPHGIGLLSQTGCHLSPIEAMRVLRGTGIVPDFKGKKFVTGRELISETLPRFDYRRNSPIISKKQIKMGGYFHKDDEVIVIEDGVLKSGVLCGSAIKAQKSNSIYEVISSLHSPKTATRTVRLHQILAINYLKIHSLTVSTKDFLRLSDRTNDSIDLVKSAKIRKIEELNMQIITNSLKPPVGISPKDYVESEAIKILSLGDDFLSSILLDINPMENCLLMAILLGVKGSMGNFYQMTCSFAQMLIDGKRTPEKQNYKRSSLYFPQFDLGARSRGYCENSISKGFTPEMMTGIGEFIRRNIMKKNIETFEGGTINKEQIKEALSLFVDYRKFTSRGLGKQIVEFLPGGSGFSPNCYYPNTYKAFDKIPEYGVNNDIVRQERNALIESLVGLQNVTPTDEFTDEVMLPVNISGIMKPYGKGDSKKNAKILNDFIDDIAYIRVNRIQKGKQTKLPEIITLTFKLVGIVLRAYCTEEILKNFSEKQFRISLATLRSHLYEALWKPGDSIGGLLTYSLTGPVTQFLIDSHHNVDGTTAKESIEETREIFSAKDHHQNKNPKMFIYLKEQYQENIDNFEKLSKFIVAKDLRNMLEKSEVSYEYYDEYIIHPLDEKPTKEKMKFANMNLSRDAMFKIKIRLTLSKNKIETMMSTPTEICMRFDTIYEGKLECIHFEDPENTDYVIILIFARNTFDWRFRDGVPLKKTKDPVINLENAVNSFTDVLCEKTCINRFGDIRSSKVKSRNIATFKDGKYERKKIYYVQTIGVNLEEILNIEEVDPYRTSTSNIKLTWATEGLNAGYLKVLSELDRLFKDAMGYNPANYSIPAALIFEKGFPTPLTQKGHGLREPEDILTNMSIKDPKKPITKATENSMKIPIDSPFANQIMGQVGRVGTNYMKTYIDEKFEMSRRKSEKTLEDMF